MTSYFKTEFRLQKRHSVRNTLQATRSLYDFQWFSQKWWSWPWPSSDINKTKVRSVREPEYISCQNIRTIGPVVWPVHHKLSDRQTYTQTAVTNILCENRRFRKVTNRPRWPICKNVIPISRNPYVETKMAFLACINFWGQAKWLEEKISQCLKPKNGLHVKLDNSALFWTQSYITEICYFEFLLNLLV